MVMTNDGGLLMVDVAKETMEKMERCKVLHLYNKKFQEKDEEMRKEVKE